MSVTTFEGIVEQGQIKLASDVRLQEHTKVYVIVPDIEQKEKSLTLQSPRLAHPERAADFEMEVVEQQQDADIRLEQFKTRLNRYREWGDR